MSPSLLAYLIAPMAFVAVLVLMHFGAMDRESPWLWCAVFVLVPISSATVEHLYTVRPTRLALHLRVAENVAATTVVIYLSGWGSVLVLAFVFVALEDLARGGSRAWRITATWSLLGIALGQVAIWQHWAPSVMSDSNSNGLALMGAFILFFIIRMAGAMVEQKEKAESTLRQSEDRFRSLIQNSSDATLVIDNEGLFSYVSPSVFALLGYTPSELLGQRATDFVHGDDSELVLHYLDPEHLALSDSTVLAFRMTRKDGSSRHVEAVVADQRDRSSVAGYVANVRDTTERIGFEALLEHRALHDSLTGLANRQLTMDRAELMLARTRRSGQPMAMCFVDLDNFKDTNDSFGHEAGDRLLQELAERLQGALRSTDTVGRLGGDEFIILADGLSLRDGPMMVAERIQAVLHDPFHVDDRECFPVTVTASIGIATGLRHSISCATPTWRSTRPRRPAGTAASCSSRKCRKQPPTNSS